MNKFGIGIITTQDRVLHPNYLNLLDQSTMFAVEVDHARTGVAPSRNRAMKKLYDAGCDYIVLFDDDAYPRRYGWQTYLIGCSYRSGADLLVTSTYESYRKSLTPDVDGTQWGMGSFIFLTRKAIDTIGYYNTAYDTYGHEDTAYMFRARRAGLSLHNDMDTSPKLIHKYICSLDIDEDEGDNKNADTMSQDKKQEYIDKNRPAFLAEIGSAKNYYPYDGGESLVNVVQ